MKKVNFILQAYKLKMPKVCALISQTRAKATKAKCWWCWRFFLAVATHEPRDGEQIKLEPPKPHVEIGISVGESGA